MLGLGVGLWGVRGRPGWTPAALPPEVLLYWSGRTLRQVASAVDGSGVVDGLSDSSTAAYLADLSSHGRPLTQASAGERPIVGYHPKGRGVAMMGEGARSLVGAASLAGARHVYAAITPVGLDLPSYAPLPVPFVAASQGIVTTGGATDAAHSGIVGLQDTAQLWLPDGSSTIDGAAGSTVGGWCRRQVVRVSRAGDLATGPLLLLRDHASAMPAWSWVHEIVVLSASATAEHHALVEAWLEWHLSTPVVACALDSLTTGYVLSTQGSLVYRLARNYWRGCVSVPSLGIPGQMISTALVGDAARLAAVRGRGRNILVLQGGANDFYNNATRATVRQRLLDYRAMAEGEGFDVVLCSIPESPFWVAEGKATEIATHNDTMAASWEADGFAAYVDVGAPDSLDGLHFSSAGINAVVALVGPAADTML